MKRRSHLGLIARAFGSAPRLIIVLIICRAWVRLPPGPSAVEAIVLHAACRWLRGLPCMDAHTGRVVVASGVA